MLATRAHQRHPNRHEYSSIPRRYALYLRQNYVAFSNSTVARPIIEILEDGAESEAFWKLLSGSPSDVKNAGDVEDDEAFEKNAVRNYSLEVGPHDVAGECEALFGE